MIRRTLNFGGHVKSPVLRTSKEVVLCTGAHEENLRVFFRRFLIVHLARSSNMDGDLGFRHPKALAVSNRCS